MNKVRWVSAAAGAAVVAAVFALPGAGVAYAAGPGDGGGSSILSGNTVTVPVSLPVNLCGISIAILGEDSSSCAGGASSSTNVGTPSSGGSSNPGIGSGNTVTAPVSVPVNVCGVSGAVAGAAASSCAGGSSSQTTVGSPSSTMSGSNAGIGSGNTVTAPVSAPVNICGVGLAVLGFSTAGCQSSDPADPPPTCSCQDKPAKGQGPGTTTTTTTSSISGGSILPATTTSMLSSNSQPGTGGADLLAMAAGAVALAGLGTGTVVLARRRNGEA